MGYGAAVVQRDQLQNHQFRRVNKDRAYTIMHWNSQMGRLFL